MVPRLLGRFPNGRIEEFINARDHHFLMLKKGFHHHFLMLKKGFQQREELKNNIMGWEEEEEEYLAHAVFEHMQINDKQVHKEEIWCPICKKGELLEDHHLIFCSVYEFKLKSGIEAELNKKYNEAMVDRLEEEETKLF